MLILFDLIYYLFCRIIPSNKISKIRVNLPVYSIENKYDYVSFSLQL